MNKQFIPIFTDDEGNLQIAPKAFSALGKWGAEYCECSEDIMIPLPDTASIIGFPHFTPLGKLDGELVSIMGTAVGAVLPANYKALLLPAINPHDGEFKTADGELVVEDASYDDILPGTYAAVGMLGGKLYVAAEKVGPDMPSRNTRNLHKLIKRFGNIMPQNKLLKFWSQTAMQDYDIYAHNFYYHQGRLQILTEPYNLSQGLSPAETTLISPLSEVPLTFIPTARDMSQLILFHAQGLSALHLSAKELKTLDMDFWQKYEKLSDVSIGFVYGYSLLDEAERAIVQDNIEKVVTKAREKIASAQLTLELITAGAAIKDLKPLLTGGFTDLRLRLISVNPELIGDISNYKFTLDDIVSIITEARLANLKLHLEIMHLPGFTDSLEEQNMWNEFFENHHIDETEISWGNLPNNCTVN